MTILPDENAEQMQEEYVCAGCWQRLSLEYTADKTARVTCVRCGDDRGFVHKSWAEKQREHDFADASEVKRLLKKLGVIDQQSKTEEEILADLGF